MSTDQQPAPHDPRYDGIYQRGGAASAPGPGVEARRIAADASRRTTTPAFADGQRRVDGQLGADTAPVAPAQSSAPAPESVIRDVGMKPEAPEVSAQGRNPFDVWIWVVAALLTGIGVYLTTAPIVFERAMMEAQTTISSSSVYISPWWNHTMMTAPALILLGVGTAVAQLFVLSIRHTLRTR